MTHGDLHTGNIIVDNSSDLKITGIVDWETGGGYSQYWEYIKAVQIPFIGRESDWDLFLLNHAIGTYPDESYYIPLGSSFAYGVYLEEILANGWEFVVRLVELKP